MKIHTLSDVHLEFGQWSREVDVTAFDADVTIMAGDIGVGLAGLEWALAFARPVIYVMGNHEYYNRVMDDLLHKAREKVAGTHVHLLENDSIVIDRVRFLGASLWTDFALRGEDTRASAMKDASRWMNDYAQIIVSGRRGGLQTDPFADTMNHRSNSLTPKHVLDLHQESRSYLERELATKPVAESKKTVVVTHHAPSALSLAPKSPDLLDAAYASRLDDLCLPYPG